MDQGAADFPVWLSVPVLTEKPEDKAQRKVFPKLRSMLITLSRRAFPPTFSVENCIFVTFLMTYVRMKYPCLIYV